MEDIMVDAGDTVTVHGEVMLTMVMVMVLVDITDVIEI